MVGSPPSGKLAYPAGALMPRIIDDGRSYTHVTTKVSLEGDFFRRDPGKTFRQNVRDMLEQLAGWMEAEVKSEVSAHAGSMPEWTGWSQEHIVGRVGWDRRWGTWAAVEASTKDMDAKDAIRTKAAMAGRRQGNHGTTPGIEGRWHPFRRVKAGIYRSRPIITANLSKDLE